jgi:hypothetical protein
MPAYELRPLTRREQRVALVVRRLVAADAAVMVVAALLGIVARGIVAAYCNPPGDPVQGGAAASYCSTVGHAWSWGAFIAAAAVTAALPLMMCRRWRLPRQFSLLMVVVALVANTAVLSLLPGYLSP